MLNRTGLRHENLEKGWDPVSGEYAEEYARRECNRIDEPLIRIAEELAGGFAGKRIIDLGGGPGQYAVEFAKRGANVVWWDVSRNYKRIAESNAQDARVPISFRLGFMDEAVGAFDLVFNRICWYYCPDDRKFVNVIRQLMKPGAVAVLVIADERFYRAQLAQEPRFRRRIRMMVEFFANEHLGIKIGHPHPSRRKLKMMFDARNFSEVKMYSWNDTATIVCLRA